VISASNIGCVERVIARAPPWSSDSGQHRGFVGVMAIADHPAAADHHVAHRAAARTEYRGVEHRVDRAAGERRIGGVEHDEISAHTRRDRTGSAPDRLRAAARRRGVERLPDGASAIASTLRDACASRCDHSSWRSSAYGSMIVFESLPTPNAPPASSQARAANVPSPRSASVVGASPATASLAASPRVSLCRHVRRVDDAPARVDVRVVEQPGDRRRAAPRDALGDFPLLLGGVNVDRAPAARAQRPPRAPPASPRADCAARRRAATHRAPHRSRALRSTRE
jgi:hypothetical protein